MAHRETRRYEGLARCVTGSRRQDPRREDIAESRSAERSALRVGPSLSIDEADAQRQVRGGHHDGRERNVYTFVDGAETRTLEFGRLETGEAYVRETGRGDITQFCYDAPARETTIRFRETEECSLEDVADTLREHSDDVFIGDIAESSDAVSPRPHAGAHGLTPAVCWADHARGSHGWDNADGDTHVHRRGPCQQRSPTSGSETSPGGSSSSSARRWSGSARQASPSPRVPTRSSRTSTSTTSRGLSLFALAPASLASGAVFHDASFPVAQGQFVILRSGSIPPESHVLFLDDAKALEGRYAEQTGQVEGDHAPGTGIEAARKVELVDALRSPEYSDDVLAVLAADDLPQEGVWFRLEGLAGEGMLAGVLLNEPDADYPVHEGDLMALALAQADDGSPMLLTVPDLLISHPEG